MDAESWIVLFFLFFLGGGGGKPVVIIAEYRPTTFFSYFIKILYTHSRCIMIGITFLNTGTNLFCFRPCRYRPSNTYVQLSQRRDRPIISKYLFGFRGLWIHRNEWGKFPRVRKLHPPEGFPPSRWHWRPVSSRPQWRDSVYNRCMWQCSELLFPGDQPM